MRLVRIDPGELRHRLRLEAAVRTPDGAGGFTESWQPVADLHGLIEPVRARDRIVADQSVETVTHKVTIRHRADLASGMRFAKDGRVLRIRTVHDPDETGRYLLCGVEEDGR